MPVVETRDLVKRYRMGRYDVPALNGVTLRVEAGEFIAIMGRSGSGKSTLLNLIGCLDRPTSGAVLLVGQEVSRALERDLPRIRREEVGFVFQHFNLIPTLTTLENVLLPLRYARVAQGLARQRAKEMLESVEMGHRLDHRPAELSGGEQQRVAIARALVNRPAVVLADEPTGEVDTQTALTIIQLMMHLNQTLGQTFLVVTHDRMVAEHAQRIVHLKDGRIESDTRTILR
ncbi:MAG: ABC transporter ATP-binding protein [Chloroflexi bacterium]|nr:ABC transporter ATP-binding protein [Chloroflexota bacterium]